MRSRREITEEARQRGENGIDYLILEVLLDIRAPLKKLEKLTEGEKE